MLVRCLVTPALARDKYRSTGRHGFTNNSKLGHMEFRINEGGVSPITSWIYLYERFERNKALIIRTTNIYGKGYYLKLLKNRLLESEDSPSISYALR